MLDEAKKDRARGALLGLALGDALGTTLEFQPPGTFDPITDMRGGGPFYLKPGQWTDDTSMALCLATSLVECQGFDARDQMERYCRWASEGYLSSTGRCFDIGNTVSQALRRYRHSKDPLAGSDEEHSAGNGSLMRLAPIPIFYHGDAEACVSYAVLSSRTTHAEPRTLDACAYYAGLIWAALNGADRATLMLPEYTPAPEAVRQDQWHRDIREVASGSFKSRQPPAIQGSGFVVRSLEAALWAFEQTDNFREGALKAANLGDDADTTAAIYGQLAGAFYGASALPADWCQQLHENEMILELAGRLVVAGR